MWASVVCGWSAQEPPAIAIPCHPQQHDSCAAGTERGAHMPHADGGAGGMAHVHRRPHACMHACMEGGGVGGAGGTCMQCFACRRTWPGLAVPPGLYTGQAHDQMAAAPMQSGLVEAEAAGFQQSTALVSFEGRALGRMHVLPSACRRLSTRGTRRRGACGYATTPEHFTGRPSTAMRTLPVRLVLVATRLHVLRVPPAPDGM